MEGDTREFITNNQLGAAVTTILRRCLQAHQIGGGIAGLGECLNVLGIPSDAASDNFNLHAGATGRVHVSVTFNIDVQAITCFETPGHPPPSENGCTETLDGMSVDARKQVFGWDDENVDVRLPKTLRQRPYPTPGCVVYVDMLEPGVILASWSLLWQAATTINAMCVRDGKLGQYIGYGEFCTLCI